MDDFNTRDLFAGLAMIGLLATNKDIKTRGTKVTESEVFAEMAYVMADAMLKEKEKRDETL